MSLRLVLGPANARKVGELLDAHEAASRDGSTAWFVVPRTSDVGPMRRELAGLDAPPGQPPRPATPFGRVMVGRTLEESLLRALGRGQTLLSSDHRRAVALAAIRATPLQALAPAARSGWLHAQLIDVADELATTGDLGGRAEDVLRAWSASTGDGRGRELAALLAADTSILRQLAGHAAPRLDRAAAAALVAARLSADPAALGDLHVALSSFDDLDSVQRALVVALGRSQVRVVLSLPFQEGREALIAPRGLVEFLRTAVPGLTEPPLAAVDGAAAHPQLATIERRLYEQVVFAAPVAPAAPDPFGPLVHWSDEAELASDPADDRRPPESVAPNEVAAHDPPEAWTEPPAVLELRGGGPDEEAALIAQHVLAAIDRGVPPERIAVAVGEPARQGPAIQAAIARAGLAAHLAAAQPASASPSITALVGLLRAADAGGRSRDLVDWLAGPGAPGGPEAADGLDAIARRRGAGSAADAYRLWKYLGHGDVPEFDELLALQRTGSRGGQGAEPNPAAFERAVAAALRTRAAAAMLEPNAFGAAQQRDLRVVAKVVSVLDDLASIIEAESDDTLKAGLSLGLGELLEVVCGVPSPVDEQPAGSIAIVGPLDVRSRYVDVLVVARAQAGSYPATEPVRRILTPRDRAALTELGWPVPTRPLHVDAERYLAYEVIARPTRQLILSWHDGDGDGKPCEPSPLLAEVRRAAGEAIPVFTMLSGSAARFAHGDERLARIAAARSGPRHRERTPDQSAVLAALERDRYSVGALQTASRCSAQWFVDHHLRPKPLSPDAAPLTAGRLRHEVLAEVIGRVVVNRGLKLSPEVLPALREELEAAAARRVPTGFADRDADAPPTRAPDADETGVPERARRVTETLTERLMRERVVAEIDATLPALCGSTQLEHQPVELELAFGTTPRGDAEGDDQRPPVTIERAGETLVLAGRIDRLDLSTSGELVVVDYKGANVDPYKGLGWVENRELQAGLYALAAEQLMGGGAHAVASLYQPVPGPVGQAARGATAEPLTERGPMSRNDRLDPQTWDELLDALVGLAADAQRSIDDGVVAPDPTRCSAGGCRYPWLCREVQA